MTHMKSFTVGRGTPTSHMSILLKFSAEQANNTQYKSGMSERLREDRERRDQESQRTENGSSGGRTRGGRAPRVWPPPPIHLWPGRPPVDARPSPTWPLSRRPPVAGVASAPAARRRRGLCRCPSPSWGGPEERHGEDWGGDAEGIGRGGG
jgi:hypothetical protein